jgi:hypothetical protein
VPRPFSGRVGILPPERAGDLDIARSIRQVLSPEILDLAQVSVERLAQLVRQKCDPVLSTLSVAHSNVPRSKVEVCYETSANLTSGNCGGFVRPRTLSINDTTMSCSGSSWSLPAKRNGGYCFNSSAGQDSWAWFSTW